MLRFFCLALIVSITVGLELQAKITSQWQKFKSTHGKRYTGEEETKRREIFRKNVEEILKHNLRSDLGEFSYTQGINEYSDMEHDEFVKSMCGVINSTSITLANEVMIPSSHPLGAPESMDWRNSGAVTGVKNQGVCGSCWTYSAIGTIESAWFRSRKELVILSEQQLLDCSSNNKYRNNGCDGGMQNRALQYVIDNGGVNTDSCYGSYQGRVNECSYNPNCKTIKITRVISVPRGNENAMMEAVANNGPLSVDLYSSNKDFMNYRGGVYWPSSCGSRSDHAVTIVGYGTESGNAYWLIKNSWGTSWGERGYMKLVRNKNMCNIANNAVYAVV